MTQEKIHFVTGRLAESALKRVLPDLARKANFQYSIQVLPITVAALLTPKWVAPRLEIPTDSTRLILPGYCLGDLSPIKEMTTIPVERGPKDLRRLPEFFGQSKRNDDYGKHDIQIIAEINHAPRLELSEILSTAQGLIADGADYIDVGCEPNSEWAGVADCVKALKDLGLRVSVDSLNPKEIGPAVKAGAELVLSVNSTNREWAPDWGCEVVVIPDDIRNIDSMESTIEYLVEHDVPVRLDPILEPIGLGFSASLRRYMETRERWPDAEIMMGIGNITELTDVDSAGPNVILLALCQELGIRSVLTTQVINWARSSVMECNLARKLVHYAVNNSVPPKHLSDQLVMLRDSKQIEFGIEELENLAIQIKDHNYRIFSAQGEVHLLGNRQHFHDVDPFQVFDDLMKTQPKNVDPSHAFYLGYEMCKALIAVQLGKQYTQDESLNWGHLTIPETDRHRLKRGRPTE